MSDHFFAEPVDPRELLVARYLDDAMTPEERAAFEGRVSEDAELRAMVELDRAAVGRLGALLGPTDAPVLRLEPAPGRARRSRLMLPLAAAAAIVLLASLALWWWGTATTSQVAPIVYKEPAEVYRRELANGFTPDWVCGNDAEMIAFTAARFDQPLLFEPRPGVTLVGWGYATNALSGSSCTLLVEAGDDRIVVLVDRVSKDRRVEDPGTVDPSLHLFRRTVGKYVLYEITPKDQPVVLPSAYIPKDGKPREPS